MARKGVKKEEKRMRGRGEKRRQEVERGGQEERGREEDEERIWELWQLGFWEKKQEVYT